MREPGPRLNDEPMNRDQVLAALQWCRSRGISLAAMCKICGLSETYLYGVLSKGQISDRTCAKITWLLRALLDGSLVAARSYNKKTNPQVFIPADRVTEPKIVKKLKKCLCGRYEECPCGCFKPKYMKAAKCQRLLSAAATPDVAKNLTALGRSQDARNAELQRFNGYLSALRSGRRQPAR